MASLDTNVVVRLLVKDDPEQCRLAEEAWRESLAAGTAFLSTGALVETTWVLRSAYKFDRVTIAGALRRLLHVAGVVTEQPDLIRTALMLYERGAADLSDYFILEASRDAGSLPVITCDERFARDEDVNLLGAPARLH